MKRGPEFNLNLLKRDWIIGISGSVFRQCVQKCIDRIEAVMNLANERGVVIAEPNPIDFAAAFFAAVYSGVPVISANPNWRQSEWEQLYSQVNPVIAFGAVGSPQQMSAGAKNPGPGIILIPTGGSSGKLKLTRHTWDTLTAACEAFCSFVGPEPIHSCCVLPLYHVSGLMQLMRSFVSSGQIVFTDYKMLCDGSFPDTDNNKLCLSLVPTQLQRMLKLEPSLSWLRTLKAIFLGGAPLSANLQSIARKLRLPIVLTYGMTETAAMVTALPVDDFLSGNASVGNPLPHARIRVVREDGLCCLPEEHGRIQIRSSSLFLGYHGLSSNISSENYSSMDDGYLDNEGRLHIVGRSDRIIISGGEKIDPIEVEDAFLKADFVDEVLVLGWADLEWGERLIAFYVPLGKAVGVEQLQQHLKTVLVNYKIPKKIIEVSQLPLTSQGKPDRMLIQTLLQGCDSD